MTTLIEARGVSKRYRLGVLGQEGETFREFLIRLFGAPFKRQRKRLSTEAVGPEFLWALRDVSFDISEGDVVGVIGRNGAGKSTLLKVLSRITEPTEGYVNIRGRLASLLEVGTGFHPELTGRENIFLNGAILGMTKSEIQARFDDIVAFSELKQFLDTPVKRYSSGMYVRLAFSVAAHLDPEILVVDEVLAVGDVSFQKKCIGKMSEVSRGGRTVLFVSHNMAAIENLCDSAMVLDHGQLVYRGGVKEAITFYLESMAEDPHEGESHIVDLTNVSSRSPSYDSVLRQVELYSSEDRPLTGGLPVGEAFKAVFVFDVDQMVSDFDVIVWFETLFGQIVYTTATFFDPDRPTIERTGEQRVVLDIPHLTLMPGEYRLKIELQFANRKVDVIDDAAHFSVVSANYYGSGRMPTTGVFVLEHHWRMA